MKDMNDYHACLDKIADVNHIEDIEIVEEWFELNYHYH